MDAGDRSRVTRGSALLAGLEAGMAAVLVMLGWLALASMWNQHSGWITAKLMASCFYGDAALAGGFTRSCVAGTAVYLALYSALGALFALLTVKWRRVRPALAGIVWGLAWYYLLFRLVWTHVNPLIGIYTHDSPMLVGHLLYGALLGRYPTYLRDLLPIAGRTTSQVLEQSGGQGMPQQMS